MLRKISFEATGLTIGVAAALAVSLMGLPASAQTTDQLNQIVAQRMEANQSGVQSQAKIDKLNGETDKALGEYRLVLQRIESLRVYNRQMEKLIADQNVAVASLREQIDNVELRGREIVPLMLKMVASLEGFIELDLPFLAGERAKRIAKIRNLLTNSEVTDAERYRQIMEAYQIENDYGRTIEAYRDALVIDGKSRTVDFLRIGRVSLLYQTADGAETGMWNDQTKKWELAPRYSDSVTKGLRMARKAEAPDLLRIPIAAAEAAR